METLYLPNNVRILLEKSVSNNLPVLLVGETGTGKTAAIRELALDNGIELVRINLTGQTGVDDIIGRYLVNEKGTFWVDGSLTAAMRKGYWVVFDELNMALPEILAKLHSLLDDDRKITINEKDGEVVSPHKNFRFFATINPPDEYVGTKELNRAFLSRFPIVLEVGYTDKEAQVLTERTGISQEQALTLVHIAKEIRKQKENGKLSTLASTRDLIYASTLIQNGIDLGQAVQVSILNKFPKEESNALNKLIGVITGGKIKIQIGDQEEFKSISALAEFAEEQGLEILNLRKHVEELQNKVRGSFSTPLMKEEYKKLSGR